LRLLIGDSTGTADPPARNWARRAGAATSFGKLPRYALAATNFASSCDVDCAAKPGRAEFQPNYSVVWCARNTFGISVALLTTPCPLAAQLSASFTNSLSRFSCRYAWVRSFGGTRVTRVETDGRSLMVYSSTNSRSATIPDRDRLSPTVATRFPTA
jgi:hypothetical protein